MKKDLASMQIFNDFISKTILNENEKEILIRYIKGDSIVKIAQEMSQSTATISRTISQLKQKYSIYKDLELARLSLLQ